MDIDTTSKIIAIVSSVIAILTAIFALIRWLWKKSPLSKQFARDLEIVRIDTVQDTVNSTCKIDVTIKNKGPQAIFITHIELEVVDIGRDSAKAYLPPSQDYSLDISHLEQIGDVGKVDLSQEIEAGKHDRFTITLSANYLGTGIFTAWKLKPTFFFYGGKIQGEIIEVWLPEPSGISFEDARETEIIEEEMPLKYIIEDALEEENQVDSQIRNTVKQYQKRADTLRKKRDTRGWRKEMAMIIKCLDQEEKLSPTLRQKLFPVSRSQSSRTQDTPIVQTIQSKDHKDDEESHEFADLMHEPDISIFTQTIRDLYNNPEKRKHFLEFMETEAFCHNIQSRIKKAVGVKDMNDFFEDIYQADSQTATDLMAMNAFGLKVIPHKLNEEEKIEQICLCLEIISNCSKDLANQIYYSPDFKTKQFIRKINEEENLWEIGHALDRLMRVDRFIAEEIVESSHFNTQLLAERLKLENNPDHISMCVYCIGLASKNIAKKLMENMGYPEEDLIDDSDMQTSHTYQPDKILKVATPQEFADAIGPDRMLVLTSFEYRLDNLSVNPENQYISWEYDELTIKNIKNLCIVSEKRILPYLGEQPKILSPFEHSRVIIFKNSTGITLSNIKLGHIPEGYCSGSVIEFYNCSHVRIVNSLMFGCGTEGFRCDYCHDFKIEKSEISNCNYSILTIINSTAIHFKDSRFLRNKACNLINIDSSENIPFINCQIDNNGEEEEFRLGYSLFNISKDSSVSLRDSEVTRNSTTFFMKHEGSLKMENNTIENNRFREDYKNPA